MTKAKAFQAEIVVRIEGRTCAQFVKPKLSRTRFCAICGRTKLMHELAIGKAVGHA